MTAEERQYRSNLDILSECLGDDYYKIPHLHIKISQAMDDAIKSKVEAISDEMIEELKNEIRYHEDTFGTPATVSRAELQRTVLIKQKLLNK